jgi:organic radical activating enzyme
MKLKVSEVFYSAQGEGRFVGVPSVFLRTFGCNFTCSGFGCKPGEKTTEIEPIIADIEANPNKYKSFEVLPLVHTGCDSYASWHPKFKDFSPMLEIDAVVKRCKDTIPSKDWKTPNGNHTHLVITGGEPLLGWQRAYGELLNHPDMLNLSDLTFETNGTQELSETFKDMLDEWIGNIEFAQANFGQWREITFSVSPKLSVSGEKWEEAIRPEIIADYQRFGITYLKFVVEKMEDFDEVDRAVAEYRRAGFMGVVYVMPVGGTTMLYDGNRVSVADEAMKRGYYYSPRLHVDLWGNGWGK